MRKEFILFILILMPSFVLANWQISGMVIGAYGKPPALKHTLCINSQGDYNQPVQTVNSGKDGQMRSDSDKRIMVGKPVPDFEVTLLDGKEKVTNKSLLGKFYLLDFWAVWCGPCVAEMENLHNAYEKFKDKNFTILSLSLDRKVEDITKFREKRWKMPWLHAFMGDEVNKPVPKIFEVMAIPKPILVGFDGRIIATEVSLRGENLLKTLADFLK